MSLLCYVRTIDMRTPSRMKMFDFAVVFGHGTIVFELFDWFKKKHVIGWPDDLTTKKKSYILVIYTKSLNLFYIWLQFNILGRYG